MIQPGHVEKVTVMPPPVRARLGFRGRLVLQIARYEFVTGEGWTWCWRDARVEDLPLSISGQVLGSGK